jgi:hypothetical protein
MTCKYQVFDSSDSVICNAAGIFNDHINGFNIGEILFSKNSNIIFGVRKHKKENGHDIFFIPNEIKGYQGLTTCRESIITIIHNYLVNMKGTKKADTKGYIYNLKDIKNMAVGIHTINTNTDYTDDKAQTFIKFINAIEDKFELGRSKLYTIRGKGSFFCNDNTTKKNDSYCKFMEDLGTVYMFRPSPVWFMESYLISTFLLFARMVFRGDIIGKFKTYEDVKAGIKNSISKFMNKSQIYIDRMGVLENFKKNNEISYYKIEERDIMYLIYVDLLLETILKYRDKIIKIPYYSTGSDHYRGIRDFGSTLISELSIDTSDTTSKEITKPILRNTDLSNVAKLFQGKTID